MYTRKLMLNMHGGGEGGWGYHSPSEKSNHSRCHSGSTHPYVATIAFVIT